MVIDQIYFLSLIAVSYGDNRYCNKTRAKQRQHTIKKLQIAMSDVTFDLDLESWGCHTERNTCNDFICIKKCGVLLKFFFNRCPVLTRFLTVTFKNELWYGVLLKTSLTRVLSWYVFSLSSCRQQCNTYC